MIFLIIGIARNPRNPSGKETDMFDANVYQRTDRKVPVAILQHARDKVKRENPGGKNDDLIYKICVYVNNMGYPDPTEADFNAMQAFDDRGIRAVGQ